MTKRQLVANVASMVAVPTTVVERVLNASFKTICEVLNVQNKATFGDFGKFVINERQERYFFNPVTKDRIKKPAVKAIKFRAGKKFREVINNNNISS